MNYYTLQIHYGNTPNNSTEELKDLPCEQGREKEWMKDLRQRLYTTGFQIQTAPGAWEFISPFRIHTVFLIKQDKKYGI